MCIAVKHSCYSNIIYSHNKCTRGVVVIDLFIIRHKVNIVN